MGFLEMNGEDAFVTSHCKGFGEWHNGPWYKSGGRIWPIISAGWKVGAWTRLGIGGSHSVFGIHDENSCGWDLHRPMFWCTSHINFPTDHFSSFIPTNNWSSSWVIRMICNRPYLTSLLHIAIVFLSVTTASLIGQPKCTVLLRRISFGLTQCATLAW